MSTFNALNPTPFHLADNQGEFRVPGDKIVHSDSSAALGADGLYSHMSGLPAVANGLYVVPLLAPCRFLGFRFVISHSSSADGKTGSAKLWICDSGMVAANNVSKVQEWMGEKAIDMALTGGAASILSGSKWFHPSLASCVACDTIVESNDLTLAPGAFHTGGAADNWDTLWIDGRGVRAFILQVTNDGGNAGAIMPLYRGL